MGEAAAAATAFATRVWDRYLEYPLRGGEICGATASMSQTLGALAYVWSLFTLAAIFRVCRFIASLYLLWTLRHPSILPDETAEFKSAGKRVEVDEKAEAERKAKREAEAAKEAETATNGEAPAPERKKSKAELEAEAERERRRVARAEREREPTGNKRRRRRRRERKRQREKRASERPSTGGAGECERARYPRGRESLRDARFRRARGPESSRASRERREIEQSHSLSRVGASPRGGTNGREVHHCRPSTDREVSRRPVCSAQSASHSAMIPIRSHGWLLRGAPSRSSPPRGSRQGSETLTLRWRRAPARSRSREGGTVASRGVRGRRREIVARGRTRSLNSLPLDVLFVVFSAVSPGVRRVTGGVRVSARWTRWAPLAVRLGSSASCSSARSNIGECLGPLRGRLCRRPLVPTLRPRRVRRVPPRARGGANSSTGSQTPRRVATRISTIRTQTPPPERRRPTRTDPRG